MKFFFKNYVLATLQKFSSLKGTETVCGPMFAKCLKKIIKKFKGTAVFEVKFGRVKKSIDLTSLENVTTALQEETSSGVQT